MGVGGSIIETGFISTRTSYLGVHKRFREGGGEEEEKMKKKSTSCQKRSISWSHGASANLWLHSYCKAEGFLKNEASNRCYDDWCLLISTIYILWWLTYLEVTCPTRYGPQPNVGSSWLGSASSFVWFTWLNEVMINTKYIYIKRVELLQKPHLIMNPNGNRNPCTCSC